MLVLRELTFSAAKLAGRLLPPQLLLGVLYPLALVRGLIDAVGPGERRAPPRSLPPTGMWAPFGVALRERTSAWLSTAALLWADRFNRSPWLGRLEVSDIEKIRSLAASRPVLITTLHLGGIFVMPSLLRAFGIPTAAVVGDKLWPVRWWRERRAQLTQIDGLPAHLRSGDARAMVRYLQPGRCLLVALDYPVGELRSVPYGGSAIRLSTASFRLARMTGAVVVPIMVRVDGLWRYTLKIGAPVPDDLLNNADDATVLAYVLAQLMPIAAARPEQALPLLVSAFGEQGGA